MRAPDTRKGKPKLSHERCKTGTRPRPRSSHQPEQPLLKRTGARREQLQERPGGEREKVIGRRSPLAREKIGGDAVAEERDLLRDALKRLQW